MSHSYREQGTLFIISSPSGVGKTTMASMLTKHDEDIVQSISFTTRSPREGEVNAKDYFFVTEAEFKESCSNNEILEYASVFGNYYGTRKEHVYHLLEQGKDVLCCIDWQGAEQITAINKDAVTIFLLPPSLRELKQRLKTRSSDSSKTIEERLKEAKHELSHCYKYDYCVVNTVVEDTFQDLLTIIKRERERSRQKQSVSRLVSKLITEEV